MTIKSSLHTRSPMVNILRLWQFRWDFLGVLGGVCYSLWHHGRIFARQFTKALLLVIIRSAIMTLILFSGFYIVHNYTWFRLHILQNYCFFLKINDEYAKKDNDWLKKRWFYQYPCIYCAFSSAECCINVAKWCFCLLHFCGK